MKKIMPLGAKLLVLPVEGKLENFVTSGGIELSESDITMSTVVEVGLGVMDVFRVGDIVITPINRGITKIYQGKPHLFIDGMPTNQGGDVHGIEREELLPNDKGDSL